MTDTFIERSIHLAMYDHPLQLTSPEEARHDPLYALRKIVKAAIDGHNAMCDKSVRHEGAEALLFDIRQCETHTGLVGCIRELVHHAYDTIHAMHIAQHTKNQIIPALHYVSAAVFPATGYD